MITPSHLVYSWALAKKTEGDGGKAKPRRTLAFMLGGLLPDLPTYLFFVIHTIFIQTTQQQLWDEVYFQSSWTPVITLSHSLILWPVVLTLGLYFKLRYLTWIGAAATVHVIMDFFVHNDDAYRHFWPLSDWKFQSPISYWDPAHFGILISTLDTLVVIGLLVWLTTLYQGNGKKVVYVAMILYLVGVLAPMLWFGLLM